MSVIDEKREPALGRTLTREKLSSISAGPDIDLVPELLDLRVLWARERRMRLVGFERIADVDYAQTGLWRCSHAEADSSLRAPVFSLQGEPARDLRRRVSEEVALADYVVALPLRGSGEVSAAFVRNYPRWSASV